MFLLINLQTLQILAAGEKREWVHGYDIVDQPCEQGASLIVDSADGKTWTSLSETEMKMLYRNASSQDAPDYATCLSELREYGATFENSFTPEEYEAKAKAAKASDNQLSRIAAKGRQALIDHAARESESSRPEPGQAPAAAPKAERAASSAPRKPGATKMVWDICDKIYADLSAPIANWKQFREAAKAECIAQGINEGTFGVQFGKWKSSKGM